jgi:hypothetical protein
MPIAQHDKMVDLVENRSSRSAGKNRVVESAADSSRPTNGRKEQ